MTDPSSQPIVATAHDPTDPILLAGIGRVSVRWAFLEAVVEDSIAGFLGASVEHVYTLTANINISTRLGAIVAVAELRLAETDFIAFKGVIKQLVELVPFRNKTIHGLWAETNHPGIAQVVAIKSAGRLKQQTEFVNEFYLHWLAEQIQIRAGSLMQFAQDFGLINKPDTSQQIPPDPAS
jgi:hypothetical protein